MNFFKIFTDVSSQEKNEGIEILIAHSTPRREFFLMMTLSVAMAVFGILLDNVVILIGSMLIAPMLYPVLTIALGMIISDLSLIKRSVVTLAKSVFFAVIIATVITLFFPAENKIVPHLITNISIVMYMSVAIVSGIAASFAMARKSLNESLPGVAVSVSLVPPLASIGVGVARLDLVIMQTGFLIFIVNVLGIVFSSMVVFSLLNLYTKKEVAEEVIKKEDKVLEKEEKQG